MTGMTEKDFSRTGLTRSFAWSPAAFDAITATPPPTTDDIYRWNLRDAANFVTRTTPWSYDLSREIDYNLRDGSSGSGAPVMVNRTVPWGGDLVVHLIDAVDGLAGNRTRVVLRIKGINHLGKELEEVVEVSCESTTGAFVGDAYYRTRFAYATLTMIELLEADNRAAGDILEIGYDQRNRTGANWATDALESNVKIALPWQVSSIHDLGCIKMDFQFTGGQTGGAGAVDLPDNVRGWRPVDLVRAEQTGGTSGAVYDPQDNSLRVAGCIMLTRSFTYEIAAVADEGLQAAPTPSDKLFLFFFDPKSPGGFTTPGGKAFFTNVGV